MKDNLLLYPSRVAAQIVSGIEKFWIDINI